MFLSVEGSVYSLHSLLGIKPGRNAEMDKQFGKCTNAIFCCQPLGTVSPKVVLCVPFSWCRGILDKRGVTVSHPSLKQADFLSCINHERCADVFCNLLCMRDGSKELLELTKSISYQVQRKEATEAEIQTKEEMKVLKGHPAALKLELLEEVEAEEVSVLDRKSVV